jgi:HEAT repeat protein
MGGVIDFYESGMSSPVDDLDKVVDMYGLRLTVTEIINQLEPILDEKRHVDMCAAVIRFLGNQSYSDDEESFTSVRAFLEKVMITKNYDFEVRDNASSTLGEMGAVESIPVFKQAIKDCEGSYIVSYFDQVLVELQRLADEQAKKSEEQGGESK